MAGKSVPESHTERQLRALQMAYDERRAMRNTKIVEWLNDGTLRPSQVRRATGLTYEGIRWIRRKAADAAKTERGKPSA